MKDSGYSKSDYEKLLAERKERLKELACINQTTEILKEGKTIEESLQKITMILPPAWQFPEYTVARIIYDGKEFRSPEFKETEWLQSQKFTTIEEKEGAIEIFYTKEFREEDEGPFLKEERDLIINLANLITGFIDSQKAREFIHKSRFQEELDLQHEKKDAPPLTSRLLLQQFLNRHNADRDLFHDLMPFKVKEILLVANLYDAYSIEGEGRFSDHIQGEYHQLNLTATPRVTGVSSEEEVFERIRKKHYDLIILVIGVDRITPMDLCKKIKEKYPYLPTYLLLNNRQDIKYVEEEKEKGNPYDQYFVWTGESRLFFAMVKLLEDKVNVKNDTEVGLTRVILLVEDSSDYYSRYLPLLYNLVLEQTKHLIEDVGTDEMYKVIKLRARPKILLARTYEEAVEIFDNYRNYLLCVISDVRFPFKGKLLDNAGFQLLQFIKKQLINLPTVLQSSDPDNAKLAHELNSNFINKNSETLLQDLKSFINYYLGFGHFVYRDNKGRQIAVAKSMKEFENYLRTIPEDSLVYHAMKNHFSLWLMARGEIEIAKIINPLKVSDFKDLKELREILLNIIKKRRIEQERGKIISFEESAVLDESNIVSIAAGSLGGKGRGLAFVNTLIYDFDFDRLTPFINVRTPVTCIIGTEEFDIFMERNHLMEKILHEKNYKKIQQLFLNANISYNLEKKLRVILKLIHKPIAVRSSSLLEDSMGQPFSGIFGTYLLHNDHEDFEMRFKRATDAIKLVYASIYSTNARTYFEAISHKIEEEKMAIVLQEVVGNQYEDYYYPHISGTAQSHNYYPVAHMKPEEGFAVAALGLGQYVVEGEKAYRFSPNYPDLEIVSTENLVKGSQVHFYAVHLNKPEIDLLEGEDAGLIKLDISEAEKHKTLTHLASVYNPENDTISPGLERYGPRVINFANILKYDYIPLAQTINLVLDIVKEALGSPVEIEYAVDLNRDKDGKASFYLLQIKPLVGSRTDFHVDLDKIPEEKIWLYCEKSMGNGLVDTLTDVIFAKTEEFDKTKTMEMTHEIEKLNKEMLLKDQKYVLIGPGRWGTRDRFIGIPVAWPQISHAKVIVEMSMEDFPLDASLGSHFFHNVTSMDVGYFSVNHTSLADRINWDILNKQKVVKETKYFKHIRFKKPLEILMDGKKRRAVITWEKSQ
jgi:CheY-like chemotaxis protein